MRLTPSLVPLRSQHQHAAPRSGAPYQSGRSSDNAARLPVWVGAPANQIQSQRRTYTKATVQRAGPLNASTTIVPDRHSERSEESATPATGGARLARMPRSARHDTANAARPVWKHLASDFGLRTWFIRLGA